MREESEHHSGETTDGLCAEKAVFHLGQFDEVLSVRRCLQIVEVLVGSDAQVGSGAAQSELLFAVVGLPQAYIRLDDDLSVPFLSHHIVVVQRSGVCGDSGLHALRKVGEVEQGCGCEVQFRLAAGNKCWRGCLAEVCRAWAQAKPAFTLRQRIARIVRIAQTHPSHRQSQRVITVLRGIALDVIELFPDGVFHHRDQRQCLAFHVCLQRAVAIHNRPAALLPTDRSQHCLTSHHMLQITAGAVAQTNHPPRGVGCLYQVGMPQSLYLTVLHLHVEVRQDGVVRIGLIWTEKVLAAKDVHMMPVLRSAFSQQQIIVTVLFIDMRSFGISPAKSYA